jgi:hypothetical protein
MAGEIDAALQVAIARGDWSGVRERLAPDVVLRTRNESGRQKDRRR